METYVDTRVFVRRICKTSRNSLCLTGTPEKQWDGYTISLKPLSKLRMNICKEIREDRESGRNTF